MISFFIGALVIFLVCSFLFPKAQARLGEKTIANAHKGQKEAIHLVAVGDSLTQGVGDTTNSGGYVPLIAKSLTETYHLNGVQTDNFGIAGNRTDQILKRVKKDKKLIAALKDADVITLTTGGNDVMKVVRSEIMNNISLDSFTKPRKNYQKTLTKLYSTIRKYNKKAPIYQFGIYNPFYVNFPELTEMQDIITEWNQASKKIVQQQEKAYFIPINDQINKGKDGNVGVEVENKTADGETNDSSNTGEIVVNKVISDADNFHPNNLGYQIMANALRDEMVKTQARWLKK